MTDIAALPTAAWRDDHFGGCPICRRTNGCRSIGRDHWYVCHAHRTKWWVGSNLFSSWRDLTPEQRFANADRLAGYREVEPIFNTANESADDDGSAPP